MVTHDRTIASYADRIVALRDGRLLDADVPSPSVPSQVLVGA
jgi:ABC-type lipoprotein export system ATPase subunit